MIKRTFEFNVLARRSTIKLFIRVTCQRNKFSIRTCISFDNNVDIILFSSNFIT